MAELPPAPPDITRMIQDGYQDFHRRYRDLTTGLRVDSIMSRTRFDPNEANFACTRDGFYVSLLHFSRTDRPRSIDRFNKCADQGIPVAPGAAVDPVDSAIHAYSKLISNLIHDERMQEARFVIEFLQTDYTDAMSDPNIFRGNKDKILLLIGDDFALRASPVEIQTNVLDLVHYLFRNEQRYIESSPLAKKVICKFVVRYGQQDMIQLYNQITPLAKAHFFVSILENEIIISNQLPQITQDLDLALMTPESPLNQLLQLNPDSNAYRFAEQIRDDIRDEMATKRKEALTIQTYRGSGGIKKKKFNKLKSRKIYKNNNKNRMQRKKSRRRHRILKI